MPELDLFLNEPYLKYGIRQYVKWNPTVAPHILCYGATGSGKTVACKLILSRIAKHIPDSQIWVNDFKGDNTDFLFCRNSKRYFRFRECEQGFDEFYKLFLKRQSGEDTTQNFVICYFDEWASYIQSLERKKSELEKGKLSTLLMMSRSYNMHILQSFQRCDSVYFSSGSRDQYGVVTALGNLTTQGKEMMLSEFKDQMKADRKQGTGYMITNGTDFTSIQVPFISDMSKMHYYIKEAVNR